MGFSRACRYADPTVPSGRRWLRCEIELVVTYSHFCGVNSAPRFHNTVSPTCVFKNARASCIWRSLCKHFRVFKIAPFEKPAFLKTRNVRYPLIAIAGLGIDRTIRFRPRDLRLVLGRVAPFVQRSRISVDIRNNHRSNITEFCVRGMARHARLGCT